MTRAEKINYLIQRDLARLAGKDWTAKALLADLLAYGHKGYEYMETQELNANVKFQKKLELELETL